MVTAKMNGLQGGWLWPIRENVPVDPLCEISCDDLLIIIAMSDEDDQHRELFVLSTRSMMCGWVYKHNVSACT